MVPHSLTCAGVLTYAMRLAETESCLKFAKCEIDSVTVASSAVLADRTLQFGFEIFVSEFVFQQHGGMRLALKVTLRTLPAGMSTCLMMVELWGEKCESYLKQTVDTLAPSVV